MEYDLPGSSSAASAGRPRSETARKAILAATYELLVEAGFSNLSIEGVAARAGVGKATIYRWWSSKALLAAEAFLNAVVPAIAFPEGESARSIIEQQILKLAKAYRGKGGAILKEMIGHSQDNIELKRVFFEGYLQPRRLAAKAAFQRGIDQGEFLPDLDLDLLIDALYGPLLYRMLTTYSAIDDRFVKSLCNVFFDGIMVRGKR